MLHLLLKKLSQAQFEELSSCAKIVASDRVGPKLLRTQDGRCVKIFRRRRRLTSGLIYPPAMRFCTAARRLARLGIPSVTVDAAYRVPTIARHVVVYRELEGITLREALRDSRRRDTLLELLAVFFAKLHSAGVYFRAIHFANILVQENGELALLDISECRFCRRSLSPRLRARNWKHLLAKEEDSATIRAFGLGRFLDRYLEASGLPPGARRRFSAANLPTRECQAGGEAI